jgi:hypothetical protein
MSEQLHDRTTGYLEIVEGSSRDVIIELPHHVPRSITNSN